MSWCVWVGTGNSSYVSGWVTKKIKTSQHVINAAYVARLLLLKFVAQCIPQLACLLQQLDLLLMQNSHLTGSSIIRRPVQVGRLGGFTKNFKEDARPSCYRVNCSPPSSTCTKATPLLLLVRYNLPL